MEKEMGSCLKPTKRKCLCHTSVMKQPASKETSPNSTWGNADKSHCHIQSPHRLTPIQLSRGISEHFFSYLMHSLPQISLSSWLIPSHLLRSFESSKRYQAVGSLSLSFMVISRLLWCLAPVTQLGLCPKLSFMFVCFTGRKAFPRTS